MAARPAFLSAHAQLNRLDLPTRPQPLGKYTTYAEEQAAVALWRRQQLRERRHSHAAMQGPGGVMEQHLLEAGFP